MERLYQLHNGDIFTVSADLFLITNWNLDNFKFIQYNYEPKPWWKFWEKRKLKSVKVMYVGNDIQNNYSVINGNDMQNDYFVINEKKYIEEYYKNDEN